MQNTRPALRAELFPICGSFRRQSFCAFGNVSKKRHPSGRLRGLGFPRPNGSWKAVQRICGQAHEEPQSRIEDGASRNGVGSACFDVRAKNYMIRRFLTQKEARDARRAVMGKIAFTGPMSRCNGLQPKENSCAVGSITIEAAEKQASFRHKQP